MKLDYGIDTLNRGQLNEKFIIDDKIPASISL